MNDRLIIFSAPMVHALLDGRKSQTRRMLKPQPYSPQSVAYVDLGASMWMSCEPSPITGGTRQMDPWRKLPYSIGDRLYVREAWRTETRFDDRKPSAVPPGEWIWFEAQDDVPFEPTTAGRLRSSIHMPRWASRLTLTVTEVRVQRLQDISEADAVAEGIERLVGSNGPNHFTREIYGKWSGSMNAPTAQEVYADLWNRLHGPDAWDANPWVVAVSFTTEQRNIDHANWRMG
jgi:hypothetical protein